MRIRLWLCTLLLAAACGEQLAVVPSNPSDPVLRDDQGRVLILHGLNDLGDAKNRFLSSLTREDVDRRALEWGFNGARFLLQWQNIEPEKGVFSEAYLDAVEQEMDWYADHGMHVILDMHQDIYGAGTNGNGTPVWATETDGLTPVKIEGDIPWWVQNIDQAVVNAWRNFWSYDRYRYLQDHYIEAWRRVVRRFRNHPAVLGYDLMNEPFAGDVGMSFLGDFEETWLADFYRRLVPAVRSEDPDGWIFLEPQSLFVVFGQPSHLPPIDDPREEGSRLGYAPHLYPFTFHEGGGFGTADAFQVEEWERRRTEEISRLGAALFVGEFGGSDKQPHADQYYRKVMAMFDRMRASWALWSGDPGDWGPVYSDGALAAKMDWLIRPYPRATAGSLESFRWDPDTGTFTMQWRNDPKAHGPTEIYIPAKDFPNGWTLEFSDPEGSWSQSFDDRYRVLRITHDPATTEHSLKLTRR